MRRISVSIHDSTAREVAVVAVGTVDRSARSNRDHTGVSGTPLRGQQYPIQCDRTTGCRCESPSARRGLVAPREPGGVRVSSGKITIPIPSGQVRRARLAHLLERALPLLRSILIIPIVAKAIRKTAPQVNCACKHDSLRGMIAGNHSVPGGLCLGNRSLDTVGRFPQPPRAMRIPHIQRAPQVAVRGQPVPASSATLRRQDQLSTPRRVRNHVTTRKSNIAADAQSRQCAHGGFLPQAAASSDRSAIRSSASAAAPAVPAGWCASLLLDHTITSSKKRSTGSFAVPARAACRCSRRLYIRSAAARPSRRRPQVALGWPRQDRGID